MSTVEKARKMNKSEKQRKAKKPTLASLRTSEMYTNSFLTFGNGKLLDFDDAETGISYRYAQFNTRAIIDCPFKSAGCTAVCYATKGNHMFANVKSSRERSYLESRRADFAERMIYTISVELTSRRYSSNVMLVRIHESGDFYSLQYLRKWIHIWAAFLHTANIVFVFYTKSFAFFNMLSDAEAEIVRSMQASGRLAISDSLDDTTTPEQIAEYLKMLARYPKTNTYRCTENVDSVKHDNVCDCSNCAKCKTCNQATGKTTVVKIHSASNADMKVYRENVRPA